jgi:hypothetical protein
MLVQVDIKTAAEEEPYLVDIVEGIRHKTMVAHQRLNKWGKTIAAERNLWTY